MLMEKINRGIRERSVVIPAGNRRVCGTLSLPEKPRAVVAFAHGSGSGRFSPRNQAVAAMLQNVGLATLLIDLLEEDEAQDRSKVFDIELLAQRLGHVALWLSGDQDTTGLAIGLFGASTGAAAALVAAARHPASVRAVVSRGGRPDLALDELAKVVAPTLLIVGGHDLDVLELNRQARSVLRCPTELVVIPRATHLFPEPGALEEVARLAEQWFLRYLTSSNSTRPI